jgi:general secretion pathway protein K
MISVKDEGARIDLNQAPPELLSGIFRAVGVERKLADSYAAKIVDWRDPDDKTSPNGGAEKDAYRGAGRVDGPRNGPFLHVGELALVMGIPARVSAAVAPYVTVASGRETINPMIADPPVLLALPGANPDRVQNFLSERIRPGAIFERLISRLGSVQDFVGEDTGDAVRFEGRVILGQGNERRFEVVAAVIGGDTEPYRILSWDSNPPDRIRAP